MIPMFSIFSQASSPLRSLIVEIRPVVLRIAVQYCEDAVRPHPQSPGPTLFFGPVAPTLVGIPLAVGGISLRRIQNNYYFRAVLVFNLQALGMNVQLAVPKTNSQSAPIDVLAPYEPALPCTAAVIYGTNYLRDIKGNTPQATKREKGQNIQQRVFAGRHRPNY